MLSTFFLAFNFEMSKNIKNAPTSIVTTVGPVWKENLQAIKKPIRKQITEKTALVSTTPLKDLHTLIADSAGKIISPLIIIAPIIFIPITIVTAVKIAIRVL